MGYRVCPYCGAHLDAGEKCDCREEECGNKVEKRSPATDQSKQDSHLTD